MNSKKYDVIVVGSGHAGCEACLVSARKGLKTLMITLNLDSIAYLACNPSIGGTAKGHLVCEIDALGGQMGINGDYATIQRRMLNGSKGQAVQSLRVQADKVVYHQEMKRVLEDEKNLDIRQGEVSEFIVEDNKIIGVKTAQGQAYECKSIVICTGVYLNSKTIIGEYIKNEGPNGFNNSTYLSKCLLDNNISLRRFKTGTPVRVHSDSINYDKMEVQKGEDDIQTFSFMTEYQPKNISDCYLTYTTPITHKIILDNIDKAPMYTGAITGEGPRYCPSIETKIVRFKDKERHQLFLEQDSMSTKEIYVQGFSTSMPIDVQEKMLHSVIGMENAHIMRDAYAIEYDCVDSLELLATLESKKIKGLFFAGQINGTSGYEEAAAQGLIAGINASQYVLDKPQLVLKRNQAYIGVLIDDLVTKGTNEPYRMMTSRAEYRLWLRQDNADIRLTEIGYEFGSVSEQRYEKFKKKQQNIQQIKQEIEKLYTPTKDLKNLFELKNESYPTNGVSIKDALKRNNISFDDIKTITDRFDKYSKLELEQIQTDVKYEGYLIRQNIQIEQSLKQENTILPNDINYKNIKGLRIEAQDKLENIRPINLGQASRISGVSPADIAVLMVYLKTIKKS